MFIKLMYSQRGHFGGRWGAGCGPAAGGRHRWEAAVLGRGIAAEASAQMERLALDFSLTWVPREVNYEADALSNLRFEGFDPSRRLEARVQDLLFLVLPTLEARAVAFYHQMAAVPERRRRRPPGKRAGLRETDLWQVGRCAWHR